MHCLFTCIVASQLWSKLGLPNIQPLELSRVALLEWIKQVVDTFGGLVPAGLWTIWCARNKRIFEKEDPQLSDLTGRALALSQDIKNVLDNSGVGNSGSRIPREVKWTGCPTTNHVTLNVDGSARSNLGEAGFDGILRNHPGTFLLGFYRHAGQTTVLHAEILGILHGLCCC